MVCKIGFRNSKFVISNFSLLILDIKIDSFSQFRFVPLTMGHSSKIKPRFVQYTKIIIKSKHNQVGASLPLLWSLDLGSLVFMI